MEAPSWLEIGELHDERHRFDTYWERLEQLPVNTPTTLICPIDPVADTRVSDNVVESILAWMKQHDYTRVFIRSGYKAAPIRIHDGSIITSRNRNSVKQTIRELLSQHVQANIPHGNVLVIRELLDLRFCMKKHVMCHPEVRYFIENGDVMYYTPHVFNAREHVCAAQYSYLDSVLSDASPPHEDVQVVANEFTDRSLSVDFVMDTNGVWYVSEIHLNGVRWNDEQEEWMNICGHADVEVLGPAFMHSAALEQIKKH